MRDDYVRIKLQYRNGAPWKWLGECTCGWGCMSWSWCRTYGALVQSGMDLGDWLKEGNSLFDLNTGTLHMSLEHMKEKHGEEHEPTGGAGVPPSNVIPFRRPARRTAVLGAADTQ